MVDYEFRKQERVEYIVLMKIAYQNLNTFIVHLLICQRLQFDTFSMSRTSSFLKRAKTCTTLRVYNMHGSCPTIPPKPPAQ